MIVSSPYYQFGSIFDSEKKSSCKGGWQGEVKRARKGKFFFLKALQKLKSIWHAEDAKLFHVLSINPRQNELGNWNKLTNSLLENRCNSKSLETFVLFRERSAYLRNSRRGKDRRCLSSKQEWRAIQISFLSQLQVSQRCVFNIMIGAMKKNVFIAVEEFFHFYKSFILLFHLESFTLYNYNNGMEIKWNNKKSS